MDLTVVSETVAVAVSPLATPSPNDRFFLSGRFPPGGFMHRDQLTFRDGFRLSIANQHSQAAVMVIPPGSSEGGPDNDHRASDQWVYVVDGTGAAIVNGHRYALKPGVILLIERGDRHELKATGRTSLKTVNIYVPPAFQDAETPRPAGKPSRRR